MDVYISRLRKYLAGDPRVEIRNIHGRGFKLVVR
jgi:DNA-binding response OmpR family regulator